MIKFLWQTILVKKYVQLTYNKNEVAIVIEIGIARKLNILNCLIVIEANILFKKYPKK
jgi:hypothetical protein